MDKMESECNQLQQELQDSKDQNELLEFRILELEVSHKEFPSKSLLNRNLTLTCIIYYAVQMLFFVLIVSVKTCLKQIIKKRKLLLSVSLNTFFF